MQRVVIVVVVIVVIVYISNSSSGGGGGRSSNSTSYDSSGSCSHSLSRSISIGGCCYGEEGIRNSTSISGLISSGCFISSSSSSSRWWSW